MWLLMDPPLFINKPPIYNRQLQMQNGIFQAPPLLTVSSIRLYVNIKVHCIRNTHFRPICFSVPNFNFKYIFKKFEELHDNRHNF